MSKTLKFVFIFLLIAMTAAGYWFFNLREVQGIVGSIVGGLDPQRGQHLRVILNKKSNEELLKLLDHGDYNKMSVASSILAARAPEGVFDAISMKLQSPYEQVRVSVRRILPYINKEKSFEILHRDLNKYRLEDFDYKDTVSILAYWKDPQVFNLLANLSNKQGAWKSGIERDFCNLGDARALSILYKLKEQVPSQPHGSAERIASASLNKAIVSLEATHGKPDAVRGETLKSNG